MKKRGGNKPGISGSDQSLKITAWIVTIFSLLIILFPFALTISNAMKDNVKIYDVPPKLFPDAAQSLSLTIDYTKFSGSGEELEETIRNDMVSAMFGVYTKLTHDSIFEIKFYGVQDGKTIFYSRAHQIELQMEKDYGVYKGTVLNSNTLLYKDRGQRAADSIGYSFDPGGLPGHPPVTALQTELWSRINEEVKGKFPLSGDITGCVARRNSLLLLESFAHYMKLPQYLYRGNPVIERYGFWVFVFNTVVVIGFAMAAQVLLCSVCGFAISRLLSPRAGRAVLLFFLGAMMIPFVSIMIPQLIMYRQMGAYNNYRALLLPFLYPYGFYIYLFKGFFDRIPSSYFEAARLDGASNFYLYTRFCMPLSKPIIALIGLQTFLGNWNDFFWAWLVTEKQELWTLNVVLYNISQNAGTKQNALLGISLVTILPVILLSLVFSRQLKQSIMASGVKG